MPGADVPSPARSQALAAAGGIAYWQGDRAAALRWYEEQLDVAAGVGDRPGIADASYNLSSATYLKGDPGRSVEYAETARRLFEELGDERGVNRVEWGLANVMAWTHEAQAIGEFERILAKAEALDDAAYVALAAGSLAWRCHASGDPAAAGRWAIVAMMGVYGMRDVASTTITLPEGAIMALGRGRPSVAATLMGAFEGLCGRYGVRPPPGLGQMIESADPLSQARAALGEAATDAAVERGRRMTLDEAMELIVGLGVE
jgi:non-specific serine/threonine protein kinase